MAALSQTVMLLPIPLVILLGVVAAFGAAPALILRTATLIYPQDHPRRRELVAELYAVKRHERVLWVSEVLIAVLSEGVPLRLRSVRSLLRWRGGRWVRHPVGSFDEPGVDEGGAGADEGRPGAGR